MDDNYRQAFCFVVFRCGSKMVVKPCYNELEQTELMLELLFDNSYPRKEYKHTYYNPGGP